jgi:hypothetical protein
MHEKEYPDLGYDNDIDDEINDKVHYDDEFIQAMDIKSNIIKKNRPLPSYSSEEVEILDFEANPSVVHFSQWRINEDCTQTITITNCSKKSLRFQIYPPASSEFTVQYDKIGRLAPGLSQILNITFIGLEYKYYYDCLRIQGANNNLLYEYVYKMDIHTYSFSFMLMYNNMYSCIRM